MRIGKPTRFPPLFVLVLMLCAFTALGDDARARRETHEPMTFQGFRVRSNIAVPVPGTWGPRLISMGRPSEFPRRLPCMNSETRIWDPKRLHASVSSSRTSAHAMLRSGWCG